MVRTRAICSVENCGRPHDSKSYCKMHYLRWKRYDDPLKFADPSETSRKISQSKKGIALKPEHIIKIRESLKKRKPNPNSLEALKKANLARIGTKRPEVARKASETLKVKWSNPEFYNKMKLVRKKQFSDPKTKEAISQTLKSIWLDPEYKKHQQESHKGIIAGMLGKQHSLETKKKISRLLKGREGFWKGKKFSEERKAAMSAITKKRFKDNPALRKELSIRVQKWLSEHPEFKEQASERRSKQKFPFKDSKSVELKIQKILDDNKITYTKHHTVRLEHSYHQADIFVSPNSIIEGFGDYWHFNPEEYGGESIHKRRKKLVKAKEVWAYDEYIINGMKKLGYNVLVVWEKELKEDIDTVTHKILKFLSKS